MGFVFLYNIKQQSQHQSAVHTLFLYKTVYPFPRKLRIFFFRCWLSKLLVLQRFAICHMQQWDPKKKKEHKAKVYEI